MALIPPSVPTVRGGLRLKFRKNSDVIFGKQLNPLIAIINAFLNSRIHRGQNDGVMIGDQGVIFAISKISDDGAGMAYRGEFDIFDLEPYTAGDVVRLSNSNIVFAAPTIGYTSIGNARPGTYVCVKNVDPLTVPKTDPFTWPQFPEPATANRYWELIGGLEHFRGEYMEDPSDVSNLNPGLIGQAGGFGEPDYVVGDIAVVSDTNAFLDAQTVPGLYVCKQDSPGPLQKPVHSAVPTPSFYLGYAYWQLLSTWPTVANACDSDGVVTEVYVDQQTPPT
jgi:hypothetical protein